MGLGRADHWWMLCHSAGGVPLLGRGLSCRALSWMGRRPSSALLAGVGGEKKKSVDDVGPV